MRHRFGFVTAFLVAIALSLASAPARAEATPLSPPAAIAHGVMPVTMPVVERAPAVRVAPVESVHVYLIAQLTVPDSIGRDTGALHAVLERAQITVLSALEAARIPVYRGALMLRDSQNDPASSILHRPIEPPNRERARSASRMPSDSTHATNVPAVLTVGLVRRR